MAKVFEYYRTDFPLPFVFDAQWAATLRDGRIQKFESAVLLDFRANARYLAFYFPDEITDAQVISHVLRNAETFLDKANNITVNRAGANMQMNVANLGENKFRATFHWQGDVEETRAENMRFTGRVFLYTGKLGWRKNCWIP